MRKKLLFSATTFLFTSSILAASLKGTADALGKETIMIGRALGVLAFAIAGIYLAMGKQEGGQKMTLAVIGLLSIVLAPTIVNTLSGIAGGVA